MASTSCVRHQRDHAALSNPPTCHLFGSAPAGEPGLGIGRRAGRVAHRHHRSARCCGPCQHQACSPSPRRSGPACWRAVHICGMDCGARTGPAAAARGNAAAAAAAAALAPRSAQLRHQRDDQACLIYLHIISLVAQPAHGCDVYIRARRGVPAAADRTAQSGQSLLRRQPDGMWRVGPRAAPRSGRSHRPPGSSRSSLVNYCWLPSRARERRGRAAGPVRRRLRARPTLCGRWPACPRCRDV